MNDRLAEMYRESQRQMREALEAVEWIRDNDLPEYPRWCPWCGNYERDGHRPDCQRQAALGLNVEA